MTIKVAPHGNNVILKVIPPEEKIGLIHVPSTSKEKSTLCSVMVGPKYSYHPNGDLKDSDIKVGMTVRIPTGNCGTEMPEAPEGETWVCVPEDLIYYSTEECKND